MAGSSSNRQVQRLRASSRAVVGSYLAAHQKLALLQPIIDDEDVIQSYNNSLAAHGLNVLQLTLFLDLVRDAVAFTLDRARRTASLRNVLRYFAQDDLRAELREGYCTPPPGRWVGADLGNDIRRIREESKDKRRTEKEKDFDNRYERLAQMGTLLLDGSLATTLKKARDKVIAHYEMTSAGSEPRLMTPEDVCLKWSDIDEYLAQAEPLIFGVELLASNTSYALDQFKDNHKRIARDFWTKQRDMG